MSIFYHVGDESSYHFFLDGSAYSWQGCDVLFALSRPFHKLLLGGSVRPRPLKLLTGTANRPLAEAIASRLRRRLEPITIGRFTDGEVRTQLTNVRAAHVVIIQPMDPRDHAYFMELLLMAYTAVGSSAKEITVVMPYHGYARQDRKDKPRVPISARLVADMLQLAGVQRLITTDLHAAQIQGFYDPDKCVVDHLYDRPVMLTAIQQRLRSRFHLLPRQYAERLVLVAPDAGATKMVESYADRLGCDMVFFQKRRKAPGELQSMRLVGRVKNKFCVMIDDTVDTAGTLTTAAQKLKDAGAKHILAACIHPILSGEAVRRIEESPIELMMVSDSLRLPDNAAEARIEPITMAGLLADAIHRTHVGKSISPLIS